jgi:hypothetical protein
MDLGTTGTRAFVVSEDGRDHIKVGNPHWGPSTTMPGHSSTEFPSSAYIYDEEDGRPVYLPGAPDPIRESVSVKLLFYLLAGVGDDLINEYPLINPIMVRAARDPRVIRRARQGVCDLLGTVAACVRKVCIGRGLSIKRIGLTIPAQWIHTRLQTVYQELASQAFETHPEHLIFITETEALAHCMLAYHPADLGIPPEARAVVAVFFDFGGHNMVRIPTKAPEAVDEIIASTAN